MAVGTTRWRWLAVPVVLIVVLAAVYRAELVSLWHASKLFDPERIVHNFQHLEDIVEARVVAHGDDVLEFGRGDYTLPVSFEYGERTYDTEEFLAELVTPGLLILQDDTILFERYENGHSAAGHHIAWSVTKSIVSALFGIAVEEGHIPDIAAPVTEHLPELAGSGYDGVPIKDVLQMSSGVAFNEDYGDPFSDINRMGPTMMAGSLLGFAGTLERERPPGTVNHYVSVDTQVLGEILVRATGRNLSDYASEKLWKPLGMEFDAYWLLDGTGMEWAFGGLNVSLRDFARFGWLYLNGGRRGDRQIVPARWVEASVTPDAPHLMPGPKPGPDAGPMGYGYQWWIPSEPEGDFMAIGVYGQMVYVDPKNRLVVVKNSVDVDFQKNDFENDNIAIALFRTIAAELAAAREPAGR
ncbi:MAG: beta-lactamase family protein [Myxococcales bacterium]|nr:beta-lactamase family protein [Myxococcales bacterium]